MICNLYLNSGHGKPLTLEFFPLLALPIRKGSHLKVKIVCVHLDTVNVTRRGNVTLLYIDICTTEVVWLVCLAFTTWVTLTYFGHVFIVCIIKEMYQVCVSVIFFYFFWFRFLSITHHKLYESYQNNNLERCIECSSNAHRHFRTADKRITL